jgi:cytidylate kinase
VTDDIRDEKIGIIASKIAPFPKVREALLDKQRNFRKAPGLIADGRDMGTEVFPDANIKIFLTASVEERAKRRYQQLLEQGISVKLADLFNELVARDFRDQSRKISPLKPADDAIIVDTTDLTIGEVMERVWNEVEVKFKKRDSGSKFSS